MATNNVIIDEAIPNKDLEEIKQLLWGTDVKYDVFRRWTQAVVFSDDEPTALSQLEGGPCAVLAPLQAFLLKNAMFSMNLGNDWRNITGEQRDMLLCMALSEMLSLVSSTETTTYLVRYLPSTSSPTTAAPSDNIASAAENCEPSAAESNPETSNDQNTDDDSGGPSQHSTVPETSSEDGNNGSSPKKKRLSHEEFHLSLRYRKCSSREEVGNQLKSYTAELQKEYGVLLLLYSVILTKGLDEIKGEVEDAGEALIDGTFGHGSQSLINLLITGRAVSNVWDNDKDLSGLKLYGVKKQSTIGFLTQLEHLRYCEVGWFLKNPRFPVWLMGSETHLTVLFSKEKNLVILETQESQARRIFSNFDTEGAGFVSCELLQDLMAALNLVSEIEYVKIMQTKLDPEQLGIVTLNSFLEEFFPEEHAQRAVQQFTVMHYNGLARSCTTGKVQYAVGQATIQDMPEVQIITDTSPMKTCMMTKWPTIELHWENNLIPSMN